MFRSKGKIKTEKQRQFEYSRFNNKLYVEMFKTFFGKKERIIKTDKIFTEIQIKTRTEKELETIKKHLTIKHKESLIFGYENKNTLSIVFFVDTNCNISNLRKEIKNLNIRLKK